ncbi:hypothetical protein V3C99_001229 [Haemonchus contortus]|uniref:Reverse transcriptase domain-containing protein n=1 Tax=Haemonchus contortus TaxID=6289 RepID=A0A7I5E9D2_HAECO
MSSKLFSAAFKNLMLQMEWKGMGVKVDGHYSHHLRFADNIELITSNIEQAEQMLAKFDNASGKLGLPLNLTKTMLMRNELIADALSTLNGTSTNECFSYLYIEPEVNMMNDLAQKLRRRKLLMLRVPLYTRAQKGIRNFELRRRTNNKDAFDYAEKSKIRWTKHIIMRCSDDC